MNSSYGYNSSFSLSNLSSSPALLIFVGIFVFVIVCTLIILYVPTAYIAKVTFLVFMSTFLLSQSKWNIFPIIILSIIVFFWLQDVPSVSKKIWSFNPDTSITGSSVTSTTIPGTIVMTRQNYKGYVTIPTDIVEHPIFTLSDERFSNLLALWTLAEHGGVWITPSLKPLTSYNSSKDFNGYYSVGIDTRYMECKKGTPFICAWRDEYSQLASFPCIEKYIESRNFGSAEKYTGMDPLVVACRLILPFYIKTIELRPIP